jgi:hypothetical protein
MIAAARARAILNTTSTQSLRSFIVLSNGGAERPADADRLRHRAAGWALFPGETTLQQS